LPGPGYYRRKELAVEDSSYSSKGFGNGFVSKMNRFGRPEANAAPHPAKYNSSRKQERVSNLVSSSFRSPLVPDEFRMSKLILETDAPPPNAYQNSKVKPILRYRENGPSATFKSVTGRYTIGQTDMPCPGSYEINSESSAIGAVAAFKSRPRYGMTERETPGPASYGESKKGTEKPKQRRQFISIAQFTRPDERPLSTFSSRDSASTSRSKIQKSTLRYVPEKQGPMPGRYNIAKATNNTKQSINGITRSVFESKTRRFDGQEGPTKHLGPGFYQPITEIKRSFHLNLDKHWA
jgi:hypothetical protein